MGRPILATKQSGFADAIVQCLNNDTQALNHIVDRMLNDDKDVDAWSKAIEFILKDRNAAFARANELKQKMVEKFSWEKSVEEMLQMI